MELRATRRAPSHPVARRSTRVSRAVVVAVLIGLPNASAPLAEADVSRQWPLQYLKADQDWSIAKGSGVTVAVIDTGIASTSDTKRVLEAGADFSNGTTSSGNGQTDSDGHGTSMATLIIGSGDIATGLAPDAGLLPVRVTSGTGVQTADLAAGVEYAVSQHVSVISISLDELAPDASLERAIRDAVTDNIVVVAAAGDEAQSSIDYPAAYPGVVAVGAIDQSGAIWSSSNKSSRVTLAAPGVDVPSEDNFGSSGSTTGTSASTAYVSATAALIRSAHPSWTAGQVIRDLIGTADPGNGQVAGRHSDQYGYGIVDPLKALQASAPTETTNPLITPADGSAAATATATTAATTASTGSGAAVGPRGHAASPRSHTGPIAGLGIAIVIVILIIMLIVVLSRRNRNRRGGPDGR